MFDIDKIPLDDKETYDLLCSGNTKGLFQVESNLCRTWIKKLKPRNIRELSDLIAIIRPGSLPLADSYLKRKNGEEEVEFLDPRLKKHLGSTMGVMLYQEQLISMVQDLANYTEVKSDMIRKFCGKKLADELKEELPKLEKAFIDNGMEKDSAKTLVDIIQLSGSYLFNLSHSVSYSYNCYYSAYIKTHYPTVFFWAMFCCANNKQDELEEIKEIFYDAKSFGIEVVPPSLKTISENFEIVGEKTIAFGFKSIKGFGTNGVKQLYKYDNPSTWHEFLIQTVKEKVKKTIVEALIKCGSLDHFNETRSFMLNEYELVKTLSEKQIEVFVEIHSSLAKVEDTIILIPEKNKRLRIGKETKRIMKELKDFKYKDLLIRNELFERKYLGINLLTSRIDNFNDMDITNNIGEMPEAPAGEFCVVGLLENVNVINSKKDNKEMAFITISDKTGQLDGIVVFNNLFINCFYNNNALKRPENEVLKVVGFKKIDDTRGESYIAKSIEIMG